VKANRCKPCKFVGVRTSFVTREGQTYFTDNSVKAVEGVFIILESKMNEQEPFAEFKARTYGRHNS